MPKSIHEQYLELRAEAIRARKAPVEVIFNHNGQTRAIQENEDHFGASGGPGTLATTYMGLPFRINPDQPHPICLRSVDGGSEEALEFRSSRRAADQAIAGNNTARAKMMLENEET